MRAEKGFNWSGISGVSQAAHSGRMPFCCQPGAKPRNRPSVGFPRLWRGCVSTQSPQQTACAHRCVQFLKVLEWGFPASMERKITHAPLTLIEQCTGRWKRRSWSCALCPAKQCYHLQVRSSDTMHLPLPPQHHKHAGTSGSNKSMMNRSHCWLNVATKGGSSGGSKPF